MGSSSKPKTTGRLDQDPPLCDPGGVGYASIMSSQTDQPHAYDVTKTTHCLTVIIRKEFDFGNLHQDWAHMLTVNYPETYNELQIDLTACGLVSSTFFAGLVQLHHVFTTTRETKVLTLIKPDPRMVRNLKMLRLDKLFTIIPRA